MFNGMDEIGAYSTISPRPFNEEVMYEFTIVGTPVHS